MNCKQGDMAVVINAKNPKNNGAIVEVLETAIPFPSGTWHLTEPSWMVRSLGRLLKFDYLQGGNGEQLVIAMRDRVLRPVSGLDDELEATRPASRFYPLSKALSEKALDRVVADVVQICNID